MRSDHHQNNSMGGFKKKHSTSSKFWPKPQGQKYPKIWDKKWKKFVLVLDSLALFFSFGSREGS